MRLIQNAILVLQTTLVMGRDHQTNVARYAICLGGPLLQSMQPESGNCNDSDLRITLKIHISS